MKFFFGLWSVGSVCVLGVVGVSVCGLAFVWRCLACASMLFSVRNYVLYRAL